MSLIPESGPVALHEYTFNASDSRKLILDPPHSFNRPGWPQYPLGLSTARRFLWQGCAGVVGSPAYVGWSVQEVSPISLGVTISHAECVDSSGGPAKASLDVALRRFRYGALGATVVAAVTQPLDVVKTTQQSRCLGKQPSVPGIGFVSTLLEIRRKSGVGALWSGLSPTLVRVFFGAGLYFSSLHAIQERFQPYLGTGAHLVAGILARSFAAFALSPVSVVKTRMENQLGVPPRSRFGALGVGIDLVKKEGVISLYSGLLPTLFRDAPYSGLYVISFVYAKQWLGVVDGSNQRKGNMDEGGSLLVTLRIFFAGVAAGTLATTMTHPADVIKTRLQLQPVVAGGTGFVNGRMIAKEVGRVLAREGVRGFFTGLPARVLKRATSTALTWTLFEEGMRRSG